MMKKNIWFILFAFFMPLYSTYAQIGGSNTYAFLNLTQSARSSAVGGFIISLPDNDINNGAQNPALWNIENNTQLSVNYTPYFADIKNGYMAFAKSIDSSITLSCTAQYINYGDFIQTDNTGQTLGNFKAGEYSVGVGAAYKKDKWQYGIATQFINSNLEQYNSMGLAFDLGISYFDAQNQFGIGLTAQNIGFQLKKYTPNNSESLPFDLQIGINKRLKYLPLRFFLTAHHLHKWDIRYNDPSAANPTNSILGTDNEQNKNYFFDKVFRHIVIGGELNLGKNIQVRVGYNHLKNKELKLENIRSMGGLSFGVGLNIYHFQLNYARSVLFVKNAVNQVGITTQFSDWKRTKKENTITQ